MDKDYSIDDIQALTPAESIRLRPRLYFDNCFSEGTLDALPFELLCHAFDEYFDGSCKSVEISVGQDCFSVHYDAGISLAPRYENDPQSKAELIMTKIAACKHEKKHLSVGEEFCNLGMATINFAAERCELETVFNLKKGHFVFENGKTISSIIEAVENETEYSRIYLKPDKSLFENLPLTLEGIREKAKQVGSKLTDLSIMVIDK
jgi:DNA gyrase/topoisomerase IV subunit B